MDYGKIRLNGCKFMADENRHGKYKLYGGSRGIKPFGAIFFFYLNGEPCHPSDVEGHIASVKIVKGKNKVGLDCTYFFISARDQFLSMQTVDFILLREKDTAAGSYIRYDAPAGTMFDQSYYSGCGTHSERLLVVLNTDVITGNRITATRNHNNHYKLAVKLGG